MSFCSTPNNISPVTSLCVQIPELFFVLFLNRHLKHAINIDKRDIETGVLPDILPAFHPGREDIFMKLRFLNKAGRKHIRCLFENPENVIKNMGMTNPIPRLCVARPFDETMVFDFAGTFGRLW